MANCIANFDENGSIFMILDDTAKGHGTYYKYGDLGFNSLEILSDNLTGSIKYIECFSCTNITMADLFFPEAEDLKIPESNHVIFSGPDVEESFDYSHDSCGEFSLVYNENELDVILSSDYNPSNYQKNGRVEIYTNDDDEILYMRIRNLEPWEFQFLNQKKEIADQIKGAANKKL